jgi:hypothetical protein
MAIPANLSTLTVTGTYIDIAGNPIAGQVKFTPRAVIKDTTLNYILINSTITVTLDANGSFSKSLIVTDDADASPTGFTYYVEEAFVGGRSFDMLLPAATAGGTLDLADVSPAVANSGSAALYVTSTQFNGIDTRLTLVEANVVTSNSYFASLNTALAAAVTASNAKTALVGSYITAISGLNENGLLYPTRAY